MTRILAAIAPIVGPTDPENPIARLESRVARLELAVYILVAAQAPALISTAAAFVGP